MVSPTVNVAAAGVTVTAKLPSVTSIGWLPASGVSTTETAGFVPGRMSSVTDPLYVSTPPASKARMVTVRVAPAGTLMVPDATRPTTGMLNTSLVGMSGAATSTTTIAAAVADRSGRTNKLASTPAEPVGSPGRHAPSATPVTSAVATRMRRVRRTALRGYTDRRGPRRSMERGGYRRGPHTRRRHDSSIIDRGDPRVIGGPGDGAGHGVPVRVFDRGRQVDRSASCRSEERRVGKECRSRWPGDDWQEQSGGK